MSWISWGLVRFQLCMIFLCDRSKEQSLRGEERDVLFCLSKGFCFPLLCFYDFRLGSDWIQHQCTHYLTVLVSEPPCARDSCCLWEMGFLFVFPSFPFLLLFPTSCTCFFFVYSLPHKFSERFAFMCYMATFLGTYWV